MPRGTLSQFRVGAGATRMRKHAAPRAVLLVVLYLRTGTIHFDPCKPIVGIIGGEGERSTQYIVRKMYLLTTCFLDTSAGVFAFFPLRSPAPYAGSPARFARVFF